MALFQLTANNTDIGPTCILWHSHALFQLTASVYRVSELIDLKSEDFLHLSLYDLCHADDMTKLRRAHVDRK